MTMQKKTREAVERVIKEINGVIQGLSTGEAIEAAEEIGSHADAVVDGLRDDQRREEEG